MSKKDAVLGMYGNIIVDNALLFTCFVCSSHNEHTLIKSLCYYIRSQIVAFLFT